MTFWLVMVITAAHANPPEQGSKTPVLDFEADLIQAERKKPDIFTQLASEQQTLDGVMFRRKDFNDFHRVDKNWRPGFVDLRGKKKK